MIAYLSHVFPAPTETFTYDEVRALGRAGVPVRVYSFRAAEPLGWPLDELSVATLPRHPWPYVRALGSLALRHPLRLLRAAAWAMAGGFERRPSRRERLSNVAALPRGALLAREPGIRLYHAQFANEAATAALVAGLLSGRPFSFRSHTAPNPQLLGTKLARASVVLSISDYDRRRLLSRSPGARVELARLGVDVPTAAAAARDPALVAAAGSLIEKKGHQVLVDACRLLVARGLAVRCEIAGEGPLRGALERRIDQEGLRGHVTLRGHLPRDETLGLLARASVAVLASVPSASEGEDGIPVALIEALARATPVVATSVSGIPELVVDGETGFLVPPGDPAALAAAIERLLRDPGLARRLGEAGREHVRREYDARRCFERAAALLEAVDSPKP